MANEVRLIDANEIPWCHYDLENYHSFVGVDKEYVDEMPTIDPESLRPKGRWEYYSTTMQECSVCKRHTARHKYEYCPRCGANMEG